MPMCGDTRRCGWLGNDDRGCFDIDGCASPRGRDLGGGLFARGGDSARHGGILDFAFVNYTTLGYGDIIPVARWRLLGPLTAMNGVLLFGWSTAVIYHVLRASLAPDERP